MPNNNPPRTAATAASRRPSSRAPFYAILLAIVVLGIGALLWTARSPGGSAADDAAYKALAQNYQTAGPPQPYTLGNPSAPVVIEEFADFECPSCGRFATITEPDVRSRLIQTGQAYYKYYDFPLPMHKNSQAASNAAACAAEQGKFWPMHDQLFNGQGDWGLGPGEGEVTDNPRPVFLRYAQAIGLNTDQWAKCFDGHKYQARVNANAAEAFRRHVEQTPTFYVNGKMIADASGQSAGAIPFDEMQRRVAEAASAPRTTQPAVPPSGSQAPADTSGIAPRSPAPAGGVH